MASPTRVEAPREITPGRDSITSTRLAGGFRWRVVGDPPPPQEPTRLQQLYTWLYEFNRY